MLSSPVDKVPKLPPAVLDLISTHNVELMWLWSLYYLGLGSMRKGILVYNSTPHDSDDFANLLMLSSPRLFPALLGTKASDILKSLFRHRHNLFSFQHCCFIKMGSRNAGMALSYDWQTARQERLRTGLLLFKYLKAKLFARLFTILRVNTVLGEIEDGEYYISNLAVYPEYQGKGLGTRLLLMAEDKANPFYTLPFGLCYNAYSPVRCLPCSS